MKRSSRHACLWLIVSLACSASVAPAAEPHPTTTALPDLSAVLEDSRRALVLDVAVHPGALELLGASVSNVPPGTHVGEPADLRLRWWRSDGSRIGARNAGDPLLEFLRDGDGEEQVTVPEAQAAWAVPFSPDIRTVTVTNLDSGAVLLEADVSAVVVAYCASNPDRADCASSDSQLLFADGFEAAGAPSS